MIDLRKLHEAATPGPWIVSDDSLLIATKGLGMVVGALDTYPRGDNCPTESIAFIAAFRNAAEKVLDVVDAARTVRYAECVTNLGPLHSQLTEALAALDRHLEGAL